MRKRLDRSAARPTIVICFSLDAQVFLGNNSKMNVEAAREYCQRSDVDIIVFTGGIFNKDKGQVLAAGKMMAEYWYELGAFPTAPDVLVEGESRTTRQNLAKVATLLACHGYRLSDCNIVAISEKWHLKGIAYLFRRLYGIRVKQVPSAFKESWAGIRGRIIRLVLYRLDPHGTGWLSHRKIKERGG